MDKETIEKYRKAGKIAAEALNYAASLVKPGVAVAEVCDKTDAKIKELGGECAFPTQVSMNDVAAHFLPEDESVKFSDQVVSIDVGAHVDGFIGDNAMTIDLSGKHADLVKASREALDNAIKIIKPGVRLREIGKVIHDAITKYGFSPVRNLSGHGLGEYNIHTKPNVPNYDNGDATELKEGDIVAIEPFASAGAGKIYESSNPTIFQLAEPKPVRNMITRQVIKEIAEYGILPFSKRWLIKKFGLAKTNFALREMTVLGMIREYPPLIDEAHGLVSQAENTVLVTKDGCEVLTKI
jgi:methionyl aminopeptidase